MQAKQYGLIKQPTKVCRPPARLSIFDDSSDEDDNGKALPKRRVISTGPSQTELRRAKNLQAQALAEDPTIFDYDGHYDAAQEVAQAEAAAISKEAPKAKYISTLLKAAEKRKIEDELRMERQVQKELEVDADLYKDKESFITSTYRKRLEERKLAEAQEEREAYLESIGDVTKQVNIDGFYRHLYEEKLGGKKTTSPAEEPRYEKIRNTKNMGAESSKIKQRKYRRHDSTSDEEIVKTPRQCSPQSKKPKTESAKISSAHLGNNLDVDSDFEINSSSDDECAGNSSSSRAGARMELTKISTTNIALRLPLPGSSKESEPEAALKSERAASNEDMGSNTNSEMASDVVEDKVKANKKKRTPEELKKIWEKRTVGEVFDAAVKRYFERRAARGEL